MRQDLADLESFYRSRQGQLARRLIGRQLRQLWPDLRGQKVLGVGYAVPFLSALDTAERALALVPTIERVNLADDGGGRTALVPEDELPLADQSVDRVVLVHAIEASAQPQRLLREAWRVLADGGRLIAIVPNRRGLWCLSERTPFGHGQPYSSGQLTRRLDATLFEPCGERGALYLPPTSSRLLLRLAVPAERIGLGLFPHFAGVVMVEAEKRIYVGTPLPASEKAPARRYAVIQHSLAATARQSIPDHELPRAA